jgi:hypothetical protein
MLSGVDLTGSKINMIGKKIGKLTVIKESEYRGESGRDIYYICDCDCGNKNVQIMGTALRRKERPTLNCKECGNKKKTKHGMVGTKIYKAWDSMKQRCFNKNNHAYLRYGGRGITISDEWLGEEGFINFMEWSYKNGFSDDKSIDRIDNDGNYEPSNCRWVDMKTQGNNKSINTLIEYNGATKTLSQWADEYEIPYVTFVKRIELGWDIERALTQEVIHKELNKLIEIDNNFYTYKEISEKFNINTNTLRGRYAKGLRGKELVSEIRLEMKRR